VASFVKRPRTEVTEQLYNQVMKERLLRFFLFSTSLLCIGISARTAQVPDRTDAKANPSFAVGAANSGGSAGGKVMPVPGTKNWPTYVTVTATGYWMVTYQQYGAHINAEGRDIGGGSKPMPKPGPRSSFRLPSAPPFSLIGMWEYLDKRTGQVTPLGKLFYVGKGGKFPIPANAPFGDNYDLHIRYFCNDDLYTDNAGSLQVYQAY
jgi:hypothetical protein